MSCNLKVCFICSHEHFNVEVLGVDLSKNMIDIGKQRAEEFQDDKVQLHVKGNKQYSNNCFNAQLI